MKPIAVRCLVIVLMIPASYVPVSGNACCPSSPAGIALDSSPLQLHLQADFNASQHQLQQQIQKNVEQRAHYLEIIRSLVIISIVLGFAVIGLGVILYKKRNLKMKSNPETEHREL